MTYPFHYTKGEEPSMLYRAVEMKITDDEINETGRVEHYSADSLVQAVQNCLYTKRLTNGNAFIGCSGRTVLSGRLGWVFAKQTP